MTRDEELLRDVIEAMAEGDDIGEELVLTRDGRWVATRRPGAHQDEVIVGMPEDARVYGAHHSLE